jgi:surface protein with Ig-like domain
VTVIVNHLRSLSGIDDAADGGRVRAKRRAQAEFLANYIQGRQAAQPGERIVSVGDYNAFQFSDGYVDSIGTIKGAPTDADRVVLASTDLVNPDLTNLVELAPVSERYSFVFAGNPQLLDHVLASHSMQKRFSRLAFGRGNADFPEAFRAFADRPERLSDHDAPVAYFAFPSAPLVTMNGAAEMRVEAFTGTYTEPGATAADSDGSWPVTVDGSVDVSHPGDYSIAYTATNGYLTTTVHRVVHVIDSVKPEIGGFSLTPATLGPPNHKLVDVTALYEISDASGRATCSLAAVSNEPADGSGDGHTASDIVVIDARRLKLRAERSGHGGGRTYTATLRCSDSSGNISTASAVARVLK